MKCKNEKMGYVMPQTTIYTLVGECPILAGSPPVDTTGSVLKPSCKPILLSTQFHKPI